MTYPATTYPATYDVESPDRIANWRAIAHVFMAIPHLVVAWALSYISGVVAVISWFVIVFTGQLPEGLANVQAMVLRYELRAWSYAGFLHEEYPPFEFTASSAEPGGTPVTVALTPELEGRNRLTVALRLLWVIPALIFATVIAIAAFFAFIVAFFAVLFTGKWPVAIRDFVVKATRLELKVNAYALLLTDEYPPFSLGP